MLFEEGECDAVLWQAQGVALRTRCRLRRRILHQGLPRFSPVARDVIHEPKQPLPPLPPITGRHVRVDGYERV